MRKPKKMKKTESRITIPAYLFDLSDDMVKEMDNFMFDYGFMYRFAFNRYIELEEVSPTREELQKNVQELEKELANKTGYPIRVSKDAVYDAKQLVTSQHELMKHYRDQWKEKYENTKKKYDKLARIPTVNMNSVKMVGLRSKMKKQIEKIDFYEQYIANKTFPSVIFGGKANFKKRQNNEISKLEWRELRNGRVSSRGDATKGGNPNLRVIETENGFALQVISNRKIMTGKTFTYEKTIMPLYIATKRCKDTGLLKGRKYPEIMRRILEKGAAYEVEILKHKGKYYVHIVVKEEIPPVNENISGFLGIDTNIDGLALSHVDLKGQLLYNEWIGDGGLQYYPSDKRENNIWELAHYVLNYCLDNNLGLAVEDLEEMNNNQMDKRLRRKVHQFCYKKTLQSLETLCIRYGVKLIKVKPHYTSVIGRLKYQTKQRVNVHISASYVIARRALGFVEKVPDKLVSILTKAQKEKLPEQNEWKQWSVVKTRITNLLKKRKTSFYKWHEHKHDIYKNLNKPKKIKKKTTTKVAI